MTFHIKSFLAIALFSCAAIFGANDYALKYQPEALQEAKSIPGWGTLRQNDNGFVYLEVSNNFIWDVASQLNLVGDFFSTSTNARAIGAHISVFYDEENINPREVGQEFNFTVTDIRTVTRTTYDGDETLWLVGVHSPELEKLRKKYTKSRLLFGHDFHITMGKEYQVASKAG